MSVSLKMGVLITKKIFSYISLHKLIFHLGQFQILGEANTCLFSKKIGPFIPFIWQIEEFPNFPPKIIFAQVCVTMAVEITITQCTTLNQHLPQCTTFYHTAANCITLHRTVPH